MIVARPTESVKIAYDTVFCDFIGRRYEYKNVVFSCGHCVNPPHYIVLVPLQPYGGERVIELTTV